MTLLHGSEMLIGAVASIFVSHSGEDDELAAEVNVQLNRWNFRSAFVDHESIPTGSSWERDLYRQLRVCDAVIFVGTMRSVASRWCFVELMIARSLDRPIFALAFEPGVQVAELDDLQWLDVTAGERAYARLRDALEQRLHTRSRDAWSTDRPPYPGLVAFEAQDAAMFFGRDPEIDSIVAGVRTERCVAVVGPSGSGKSSLVRAGVIPRLRIEGEWVVVGPLKPGRDPVAALARALAASFGDVRQRSALQQRIGDDSHALVETVRDLITLHPGAHSALLVVDQAEELVVLAAPSERVRLLALLRDALAPASPLAVLLTMRSEFLTPALRDGQLVELIGETILTGPPAHARLGEVIAGPARKSDIDLGPGLVERMLEDTRDADALPLLAFTLRRLYDGMGAERVITANDYDHVGGVHGALLGQADQVHAALADKGLGDLVMPTLLQLVTLDAADVPTRRRVAREAFKERQRQVLEAFVEARLVTSAEHADEVVFEVAHEALFHAWPPLLEAIESSRGTLRLQTQLRREAAEWQRQDRADAYLLRGERLKRLLSASRGMGLSEVEREFLDACRAFAYRERVEQDARRVAELEQARRLAVERLRSRNRLRYLVGVLACAASAVGALAVLVDGARRTAGSKELQARTLQLAALAQVKAASDPELALVMVKEAMALNPRLPEVEDAARVALGPSPLRARGKLDGGAERLAFSADGQTLVASGAEAAAVLAVGDARVIAHTTGFQPEASISPDGRVVAVKQNLAQVQLLRSSDGELEPSRAALVNAVGFAPDGRALGVALRENDATGSELDVVEIRTGRTIATLMTPGASDPWDAWISPDGRHVFSEHEHEWRLWTISGPTGHSLEQRIEDDVTDVAFSADGRRFIVTSDDTLRVFDTDGFRRRMKTAAYDAQALSADGRRLALAAGDHVEIWDLDARRRVNTRATPSVQRIALNQDGTRVLSGGIGAELWDADTSEVIASVSDDVGGVSAVALSPTGELFATADNVGNIAVRYAQPDVRALSLGSHSRAAEFDPSGRFVVVGGADGVTRVWSTGAARTVAILPGSRSPVRVARMDGEFVFTVAADGTFSQWDWQARRRLAHLRILPAPTTLDIGPGTQTAVEGTHDGQVRVYRLPKGTLATSLAKHRGAITVAALRPDGTLVTAARDGPARVWDASGLPVGPPQPAIAAAVSAEGDRYVTVEPFKLTLHGPAGRRRSDYDELGPGERATLALSDDGQQVAAVTGSGRAVMWGFAGSPVRVKLPVSSAVAVSGDGRFVAVLRVDGFVEIVRAPDGQKVSTLPGQLGPGSTIAFSRDGRYVLALRDGVARLISCDACIPTAELKAAVDERAQRRLTKEERDRFSIAG